MLHVPGREKLPLLDIDRAAGARRGDEQIGLAAEKGGDLQDVDSLRGHRALRAFVDVGQHGQARGLADFGEDRQRRFEPDAPRAAAGGAVGLVERGLEDETDVASRGDLLQRRGHFERVGAAFELAGAGDEGERQIGAEGGGAGAAADADMGVGKHARSWWHAL